MVVQPRSGTRIDLAISRLVAAWNTDDGATRWRHLEAAWSDDGVFTDPAVRVAGRRALANYIAACRARRPGARFVVRDEFQSHHGQVCIEWALVEGGETLLAGRSVGELDDDGRIRHLVGFFANQPRTLVVA